MPKLGMTMEEGTIVTWLVELHGRVERGSPLLVVESEKAEVEIEATASGVLRHVFLEAGETVPCGTLMAAITESADEPFDPEAFRTANQSSPVSVAAASPAAVSGSDPTQAEAPASPRKPVAPAARKRAKDLGIDPSQVPGTGPGGRVTVQDVDAYSEARETAGGSGAAGAAQSGPSAVPIASAPEIDFSEYGEVEVQPLNTIRRASARNLHRSWITVPHVTQFDEADITDLEAFRRSMVKEAKEGTPKLTMLVFLMKSLAVALRDFPQINASLDASGEALILKKYLHVGVAVDTDNGLMVPVIRDVDKKGLVDLSREVQEVSEKARNRKLDLQDMSGGSITISSLGGIGGTAFTPIVNAPEVAILGVSRSQIKPIHRDGEFVPRLMLPLSLSYDHRVIDGADAARFCARLKTVLSDIRNLLL
jgi:pyruvate dehydrogenase E2 component (dihydrolipoamide acetyltransferase)